MSQGFSLVQIMWNMQLANAYGHWHANAHAHTRTDNRYIYIYKGGFFVVPFCRCICLDFVMCLCFHPFLRPWRWFFCAFLRVFLAVPDQFLGRGIPTPKTRTVVYLADVALRLYGFGPEVLGGFSTVEVAGSNFLWWRFSLPSVGICRVPSQQKNRGPFWYRAGICWVWWFLNIFYSSGSMLQLWSSLLQIPSRRSLSQWVELVWSLDLSRFSFLAEVDSCFPP